MKQEEAVYVAVALKAVCLATGLPLNIYELARILSYCRRRSMSRYLLMKVNLVMSDIMILGMYCGCSIPWLLVKAWYGGDILCKTVQALVAFSFYLSSFVVCCIAVERCTAVVLPQKSVQAGRLWRAKVATVVAWGAASLFTAPLFSIWEVWTVPGVAPQCTTHWLKQKQQICIEELMYRNHREPQSANVTPTALYEQNMTLPGTDINFSERAWRRCILRQLPLELAYGITHMTVVFWLPVLIIVVSNAIILSRIGKSSVALRNHAKSCKWHKSPSTGTAVTFWQSANRLSKGRCSPMIPLTNRNRWTSHSVRARASTIKNTLLLSIKYVITWCPYCTVAMLGMIYPGYFDNIFLVTLFITDIIVVNCLLNPFLYKMPPERLKTIRTVGRSAKRRHVSVGVRKTTVGEYRLAPNSSQHLFGPPSPNRHSL